MAYKALTGAVLLAIFVITTHASISGYVGQSDEDKFMEAITRAFVKLQADDVITVYYGAKGYSLLNRPVVKVLFMDSCAHLKHQFKPESSPEACFHALSAWSLLKCEGKLHSDATIAALQAALVSDKSTTADIHQAAEALKTLGQSIPSPAKVSQLLQARLKDDDSLLSLGHALHAASLLGNSGKFMLDRVEDVVVQADEVDGKMLQWEGGLTTTSLLLTGLLKLPGAQPLTQAQADKFATYLLNRRTVQNPRGAVALIEALQALASSSVSPVSITLLGPSYVTNAKPELRVQVSNVFGQALKQTPTPVVAQSATRIHDDVVVLSKQPLTAGKSGTEFVLPLNIQPGHYKIALTAGSNSASIPIRVLGPVTVKTFKVGLGDADGSGATKLVKLQIPSTLQAALQADSGHHLILKFALDRHVHQTFLKLSSGRKEIVFVAEKDGGASSQTYKVEVNLAQQLARSDVYDMELLLGDAVMSNPIRWAFGKLDLKLGFASTTTTTAERNASSRGPKPEIEHSFRPAEKRPPQVVSLLFTGLVAAPLLLLLALWAKLGINLKNFSVSAVPFHAGFAAILGLFGMFWLRLDMFTTCGWLIPLGGFTFIAGNRFLRKIAKQRKH